MNLQEKSLTQLRGMAQLLEIPDFFKLQKNQLIQQIETRQVQAPIISKETQPVVHFVADDRETQASRAAVEELLAPFISRGLRVSFQDDGMRWQMSIGDKHDDGTMDMPMRTVLYCANRLMGYS